MGKPQPAPTKQSVITKPTSTTSDPFGDAFAVPAAPAPIAPSVNPFDDLPATTHQPAAVFPPVPPPSNPAPKDEFDLLFEATPTKPATTNNSATNPPADDDFDKFFASLDVK